MNIKGVRINSCSIRRDDSSGDYSVGGNYSLISGTDKVLTKQDFSKDGYNDVHISFSTDTISALNNLIKSIDKDLLIALGLEE